MTKKNKKIYSEDDIINIVENLNITDYHSPEYCFNAYELTQYPLFNAERKEVIWISPANKGAFYTYRCPVEDIFNWENYKELGLFCELSVEHYYKIQKKDASKAYKNVIEFIKNKLFKELKSENEIKRNKIVKELKNNLNDNIINIIIEKIELDGDNDFKDVPTFKMDWHYYEGYLFNFPDGYDNMYDIVFGLAKSYGFKSIKQINDYLYYTFNYKRIFNNKDEDEY